MTHLERSGTQVRSSRPSFSGPKWSALTLAGIRKVQNESGGFAAWTDSVEAGESFCGHWFFCRGDAQSDSMAWAEVWDFLFWNWGDLASVLGLAVSVATLLVASKAREAAEAAKAVARRQNFTEVLQDAVRKNEQVGLFLSQRKWDIVWLRAQETANAASLALTRWPMELGASSKDNLFRSQQLSGAIDQRCAQVCWGDASGSRDRADIAGTRESRSVVERRTRGVSSS